MSWLNVRCALVGLFVVVASAQASDVTGVVQESGSLTPIAGALVSLQAADVHTLTAADGTYTLDVPAGISATIVAARKGYFNASAVAATPPSVGIDIQMDAVPQDDDSNYAFVPPSTCSICHSKTWADWNDSPMQKAGLNTWVHDIYSGTGTPGGMGGFVYTRDSAFRVSNPSSECAACHQPELWIANGFQGAMDDDLVTPPASVQHGISCDSCHKIANIDESRVNYPGIVPESVTLTRPQGPSVMQVQYGVLGDSDYSVPSVMRSSYQPQLRAAVCAACHQDKNDPDGDGHFEEPNGIISEPTYLEWLASPYADVESPQYRDCVDCHMPPTGEITVCDVAPVIRDPDTIRSHSILGTTPEFLENAVELELTTSLQGRSLVVDVDVVNAHTGHHVPTGVTIRNMILLVEAWKDGDDPASDSLRFLGTQKVHDLGGVGDPAMGYYAGLPGKYFAKRNHDGLGNGPTFFTDATGILFDNRIPALATDSSRYPFLLPASGGTYHVRARLIYRRSFRFLTDAKGWTEDGHGNPLADLLPPHFGHLMELAEETLVLPPRVQVLRPEIMAAGTTDTRDPPAPLAETPGSLQLSTAAGSLRLEGAPPRTLVRLRVWDGRKAKQDVRPRILEGLVTDNFGEFSYTLPESLPAGLIVQVEVPGFSPPWRSEAVALP